MVLLGWISSISETEMRDHMAVRESVDVFLFLSVPDSLAVKGWDHQPSSLNRVGKGHCDDLPLNLQMSAMPELR